MNVRQSSLDLAPVDMRIFTPIDILKTQLSRAYYCQKNRSLAECFDDCCALFRERRGVAPTHAFCDAEMVAALGSQRNGITIAVPIIFPTQPRVLNLISDEASPA